MGQRQSRELLFDSSSSEESDNEQQEARRPRFVLGSSSSDSVVPQLDSVPEFEPYLEPQVCILYLNPRAGRSSSSVSESSFGKRYLKRQAERNVATQSDPEPEPEREPPVKIPYMSLRAGGSSESDSSSSEDDSKKNDEKEQPKKKGLLARAMQSVRKFFTRN